MLSRPAVLICLGLALPLFACGSDSISGGANELPDAAVETPEPPPPTQASFTREGTVTIASVKQGHLAFPDVTRLADGRLMLVYRQGASHVEVTGRLMKQFSTSDGLTWTDPEVLYDVPNIDDRDPSITTLSNGDVLVNYFQYRTVQVGNATLTIHHIYVGRSTDNGDTFAQFDQADDGTMFPSGPRLDATGRWVDDQNAPILVNACSSRVVETIDGQLILPAYGGSALNAAVLTKTPKWRLSLLSTMTGSSWLQDPVLRNAVPDSWLLEPSILQLASGTTLLHVRTALGSSPSNVGKMLQSVSTDGQQTWSLPTELPFVGHAPDLVQFKSGLVLSGYRELDSTLTRKWASFSWSVNDGNVWSPPIRVADCGMVECGYPSIVEIDSGRFLFIYYTPGGSAIKGVFYHYTMQ